MLLFLWYRLDSDEHDYPRSIWLNTGVIGLALIALPYYLFRTRGALKGLIATVLFLGCGALWGLLAIAGQNAIYYGVQG